MTRANGFDCNGRLTGLAGLIAQQPVHARLGTALLPAPDNRVARADLLGDVLHRPAARRGKDHLSPLDMLTLVIAVRHHRLRALPVRR